MSSLNPDCGAIVLAAGKGTRMQSDLPKPLVNVAGKPMIHHLCESIQNAGMSPIAVVVGHGAEQMRASLGTHIRTPLQEIQDGTASAVEFGKSSVDSVSEVFVSVGDSPLIRSETLTELLRHHRTSKAACTFLTAHFERHYPYGRVLRDNDGVVTGCVEERSATEEQKEIREYLTSHYLFDAKLLWKHLPEIEAHPESDERYLTDIIALLIDSGQRVETLVIDDWRELVGLNTPEDVKWAEERLKER